MVKARGNPSGKAETVSATTIIKTSLNLLPLKINNIVKITETTIKIKLICLENFSILIVRGDFSSCKLFIEVAILPISVLLPVSHTTQVALPVKILQPAYNIFFLSWTMVFSRIISLSL